ncbi:protein strawberry notch homolog 2 [Erinaceus europaeus]|uniref:Protein strawberry notch homolog 2 n=1 Tax=Erinaceus europaeus TaxID=9365 RepID=A0ABM3WNR9_ERIEU|nr:protein strawberry notch homolog 2 [Erinaceus europaeus]
MDGGEFPQAEPPPTGSLIYSPPGVQGSMLHYPWLGPFPPSYPAFSHTAPFLSPSFLVGQGGYSSSPSFLPKRDFPQVRDPQLPSVSPRARPHLPQVPVSPSSPCPHLPMSPCPPPPRAPHLPAGRGERAESWRGRGYAEKALRGGATRRQPPWGGAGAELAVSARPCPQGALTHGDRRATESRDLSKYNFENKYGKRALSCVLATVQSHADSPVPLPRGYPGGDAAFFRDMKQGLLSVGIGGRESRSGGLDMEKDCSITKFLNRILGLEVHKQNALFQYFSDTFDHLIDRDKKEGKYDLGILDLAPGVDEIYEESQQVFQTPGHPQDGQVVLYKVTVDRGLRWEQAFAKSLELTGPHDGFYLSYKARGNQPSCLLAEQNRGKLFTVYKPNIGRQSQLETHDSLGRRFHQVPAEEAREHWENSFNFSLTQCSHVAWNRQCRLAQEGRECSQGLRLRHHYVLCGALLRVWGRVAAVMAEVTGSNHLQIVRLKTKDQKKQVGIKVPEVCVRRVLRELQLMDADVKRKNARPPPPCPPALGPHPEVLDLTHSPPAARPPPFAFPPALLEPDINYKEVLEEMLRFQAEPRASGAERGSVIQFGPPFPEAAATGRAGGPADY